MLVLPCSPAVLFARGERKSVALRPGLSTGLPLSGFEKHCGYENAIVIPFYESKKVFFILNSANYVRSKSTAVKILTNGVNALNNVQ